jgi:hypothetical protein
VDFVFHDLRQALCLGHLEGEPFCYAISPGKEPAEGFEDIGELCKVNLTIDRNVDESVAPPFIGGEKIVSNARLPAGRNADATLYCEAFND